jgi:hypothetical protein
MNLIEIKFGGGIGPARRSSQDRIGKVRRPGGQCP